METEPRILKHRSVCVLIPRRLKRRRDHMDPNLQVGFDALLTESHVEQPRLSKAAVSLAETGSARSDENVNVPLISKR